MTTPLRVMDRFCVVCHQPISDEERWFRVLKEYVHLSCSEKYLELVSKRRQQAKTPPAPDTGE
jgi:predicted nucleic acid-binding Zn ribbon protein